MSGLPINIKTQNKMKKYIFYFAVLLTLAACRQPEASVPSSSTPAEEEAAIYPDYRDIVIPPNIAPLNVRITSDGDEFVGHISGNGKEVIAAAGADGKLKFDSIAWHELLDANKGKDLQVRLYSLRQGQWLAHPAYTLTVAEEPIDLHQMVESDEEYSDNERTKVS